MTKIADNAAGEAAKKALAEDKKVADKSRAEYGARAAGQPTPTQEENDLAALGANILEHDDDGSGPDPNNFNRSLEADKPASGSPGRYQTRAAHAGGTHRSE